MADIALTAAQISLVDPDEAEVFSGIAGEAVTAGQALYLASTGKYGVADANAAGKQQFRGIALNAAAANQAISILKCGKVYGYTLSQAYDAAIFLSDTAGAFADAAGTMTVNCARVAPLSDNSLTKVLHIAADWLRTWS